jgi:hypothetical protein
VRPLSGLIILSGLTVYHLAVAAPSTRPRPRATTTVVVPYNKGSTDRAGLGNPANVKIRVDELLFPENEKAGEGKEKPSTNAQ